MCRAVCRSGNDETSSQLRDENAEQSEVSAAVDITGDDAQYDWDWPADYDRR